jgi:N-acetyl-alpha-D-muramate 1-phosphate uridylyltransferase
MVSKKPATGAGAREVMKRDIGSSAFILAAGLGTRMRPLTSDRPKPLITVGGQKLIDYAVDALRLAGVEHVIVNAHYHADQIEQWAQNVMGFNVMVSDESARLLDTGGGILKALPFLGNQPFFVLNSDGFWLEEKIPALQRLRESWNDAAMDCQLLICPVSKALGYEGQGDFQIGADGRLSRRTDASQEAFAYIGGYLVNPRLFTGVLEDKFSMNRLWDKAIAAGRLYGLVHDGLWLHVGTPEAVAMAETHLRKS